MRVDDQILGVRRPAPRGASQQEVAREIDALDVESRAPREFHVDEGQRDRNPRAPLEYFVQETVPWIFVMPVVADEAELAEEVIVERHHAREPLGIDVYRRRAGVDRRRGDAALRFAPDDVELIEVRSSVE